MDIFGGVFPQKIVNHEKPRIFFKAAKFGSYLFLKFKRTLSDAKALQSWDWVHNQELVSARFDSIPIRSYGFDSSALKPQVTFSRPLELQCGYT